jgi:hypothetical protein
MNERTKETGKRNMASSSRYGNHHQQQHKDVASVEWHLEAMKIDGVPSTSARGELIKNQSRMIDKFASLSVESTLKKF